MVFVFVVGPVIDGWTVPVQTVIPVEMQMVIPVDDRRFCHLYHAHVACAFIRMYVKTTAVRTS